MSTLYVIRHGETVWNRERRIQGSLDSPLTWRGCEQARLLGECLAREQLAREQLRFVVSPLARTVQTAAIIGDVLGVGFHRWERQWALRELAWGEWEGLRYEDIKARMPGVLAERERDRWQHRPPGGETYVEAFQRAGECLASIPENATAVMVSHGGFGRLLRGRFLGLAPAAILTLDAPQDALFRLHGDAMDRLEISEVA